MKLTLSRAAFVVLALLALLLGYNMVAATSRYIAAYDAVDRLALELDQFEYGGPLEPVHVAFGLHNPSGEMLDVLELEITLRVGVHPVGGGEVTTPTHLGPRQRGQLSVVARIDDKSYVEQFADQQIEWQIRGRVLVRAYRGADAEWISFGTRYVTEPA